MATPATPLLVDSIDSFYEYVKQQVQTINNARQFGGIVQARDWPLQRPLFGAPYLLIEEDNTVRYGPDRRTYVSQVQPAILFKVSWSWIIQGDNIASTVQASNRGNKYRLNLQLIQEMLGGHFPGFCNLSQYGAPTDDGSGNPVAAVTPYNPPQQIRWSQPKFRDRLDTNTGNLYCFGTVGINGFAPAIMQ